MAPSSAVVLAALERACEEKLKELNTVISVTEKLLRVVEDVERKLEGSLEKKIGKPIISKFHSFSFRPRWPRGRRSHSPSLPEPIRIPQNPL